MAYTWVQDRTGRNVIHRAGCSHITLDFEAATYEGTLDEVMIEVAADNCDPDIATVEEAAEWVSIARCAR